MYRCCRVFPSSSNNQRLPVVAGTYVHRLPPFWDLEGEPDVLVPLKTSQSLSPTAGSHHATLMWTQVLSPTSSATPAPQPAPGQGQPLPLLFGAPKLFRC